MNLGMNKKRPLTVVVCLLMTTAAGAVAQTETASVIRLSAVRDAYPFWSPDGKQIVFQSDRHDRMMGDRDIYVMDADGANVRRLVHRAASWVLGRRLVGDPLDPLAQGGEAAGGDGCAGLLEQTQVEAQVVERGQPGPQQLAGADQMAQVRP